MTIGGAARARLRCWDGDRHTGGRFPELEDAIHDVIANTHRREWFSLYSTTPPIGDYMNVKGVLRGNFRIHPVGRLGESDGCITLTHPTQLEQLRAFLHSQKSEKIPGPSFSISET